MLCSFTNQVLVQPDLLEGKRGLQKRSSLLARESGVFAPSCTRYGAHRFYPGSSLFSPNASDTWKCCSSHVSQVGGQQIPRGGPTRVSYVAVCTPSSSRCFCLRRTRNPTPKLRANRSFVHCCLCPAVLTSCSQSGWMSPPGIKQVTQESTMKARSRVVTTVIEL